MWDLHNDARFADIRPLTKKALLASPTMHGPEMEYMKQAYTSGWMTTLGDNITKLEQMAGDYLGVSHTTALASGTAAIHLAVKLAAEKIYHSRTGVSTPDGRGSGGALLGRRVFCQDLTFCASVNPIVYEGGEPVFIDSDYETWNMDPEALERAFEIYPDVKIVVLVHLYGTPAKTEEIRQICQSRQALLIEDAAESLGAKAGHKYAGTWGDYGILSFNGNKIITGSSGGMLLCEDAYSAGKARKWSAQSREDTAWYEHEELGYNYRMSNVIAGAVRGQWEFLEQHIREKRNVYHKYARALRDLPVSMNPVTEKSSCWLSCCLIDQTYLAETVRSGRKALYHITHGKTSPQEALEALESFCAEGRPLWKPMHEQPVYAGNSFVTVQGDVIRGAADRKTAVSTDLFNRGFCLPSDNKLDDGQIGTVSDIIHRCFL